MFKLDERHSIASHLLKCVHNNAKVFVIFL